MILRFQQLTYLASLSVAPFFGLNTVRVCFHEANNCSVILLMLGLLLLQSTVRQLHYVVSGSLAKALFILEVLPVGSIKQT